MEIDDFCGTTFNDGKLTVIGWDGERSNGQKLYSCRCSICAEDPELYSDAIFRITKGRLVRGIIPCGCSQRTNWSTDQYRVLLSRKSAGRYSVIVPDGIKNKTKVQCTCLLDNCDHVWEAEINNLLNIGQGCRKCAGTLPLTESEAIARVQAICSDRNWIFNEFKDGWINVAKTKLNLKCHCGCEWSPLYNDVVNLKNGCPSCAKTGYDNSKRGWFYTHLWTHKGTKEQHLKYGISNVPVKRIKIQRKANSNYTAKQLCSIPFEDGTIAANLEKVIDDHKRNNNIQSPVSKLDFPDGFTETLPTEEWSFISNLLQERSMMRLTPL